MGRGGRKITDEGEAELCHCQLGVGKNIWDAISKYCDSFCAFCVFRQLSFANESCAENSNAVWGEFQDLKNEIHPDMKQSPKHCRILSRRKFWQEFVFFPILCSSLVIEVFSKTQIKMLYLTENTTVLSRYSLPPHYFFSNLQENKLNLMHYFSLREKVFFQGKMVCQPFFNLIYCYCKWKWNT